MKSKKNTGSFYTPLTLADFLVDYVSTKLVSNSSLRILEPSAGDGSFIQSIYQHSVLPNKTEKVVAIEQDKEELNKIALKIDKKSYTGINADFLVYQASCEETFSLIIGNPPYIKKNLLDSIQLSYCKNIHDSAGLDDKSPKNIWTAFLVRCIELVDKNGVLAFILPAEFLQVNFASELRNLVQNSFERVEIFTFNELLFSDCKGQDIVILIGERKSTEKGVYFSNIEKLDAIDKTKIKLTSNVKINQSKWTHHHLDSDEIELLERLKSGILTANDYCHSKAGIVTAANDFFIVTPEIVEKYSLHSLSKPIIQKSSFINGSVDFCSKELHTLMSLNKPTYLLSVNKSSLLDVDNNFFTYKLLGEERQLHKRYKTSLRQVWYEVPNIGTPPDAFFFKRCSEYPKIVKNSAGVLATDSAYIITMKDEFHVESLISSFYNSLTLSFVELAGRYYGGGVLELTPNEFKKLPVPYTQNSRDQFDQLKTLFKSKSSFKDICKQNDRRIIKSFDNRIDDSSIDKLLSIREKLYLRRIKAI